MIPERAWRKETSPITSWLGYKHSTAYTLYVVYSCVTFATSLTCAGDRGSLPPFGPGGHGGRRSACLGSFVTEAESNPENGGLSPRHCPGP